MPKLNIVITCGLYMVNNVIACNTCVRKLLFNVQIFAQFRGLLWMTNPLLVLNFLSNFITSDFTIIEIEKNIRMYEQMRPTLPCLSNTCIKLFDSLSSIFL